MSQPLAIYLNDHLAGSTVALELLEHLEQVHSHTTLASFCATLRVDIGADRKELEELMQRLNINSSKPRRAMAWLSEKLAELKLHFDDAADGSLRQLEALDAVGAGIEGKRSLWTALAAANVPGLTQADYTRLEARALEQRSRVEMQRLEAAQKALRVAAGV